MNICDFLVISAVNTVVKGTLTWILISNVASCFITFAAVKNICYSSLNMKYFAHIYFHSYTGLCLLCIMQSPYTLMNKYVERSASPAVRLPQQITHVSLLSEFVFQKDSAMKVTHIFQRGTRILF